MRNIYKRYITKYLIFGIIIISMITILTITYDDDSEDYHQYIKEPVLPDVEVKDASPKNADNMFGTKIPKADYIPKDYSLQRIFMIGDNLAYLLYSDEKIVNDDVKDLSDLIDILSKMQRGEANGPKLVIVIEKIDDIPSEDVIESTGKNLNAENIVIGEKKVILTRKKNTNLIDLWHGKFHLQIGAYKDLSIEELKKIGGSINDRR